MPIRLLTCAALLAALLVEAGGCSGSGTPNDDLIGLCTQLTSALCAKNACSGPFAPYADATSCANLRTVDCLGAAERSGAAFDPAALSTCTQQLEAASCFDHWAVLEGPACAFLYTGQLAENAPCQRGEQCTSGSCSAGANQCGVCRAVAAETESCADRACAPHLQCQSGVCVRFRTRGEACVTVGAGPSCDFPFACVSGTCQDANAGSGATCAFAADTCDTSLGLLCNVADGDAGKVMTNVGTCQPYTIVAAGESCNAAGTACGPGVTCVVSGESATCVVDPAEGAACNASGGAPCLYPLACVNGTCTKPVANACP